MTDSYANVRQLCYDLFLIPQTDNNSYMRSYFPGRFFMIILPFKGTIRVGYDYYESDTNRGWLYKYSPKTITVAGVKVSNRKSFKLSSSTKDEMLDFILSDPAFDGPTRNMISSIFDGSWIKQFNIQ